MKSIKYLLLALTVGLISTSCEKEKVDFNWKPADMSKAFVQIYDMRLVPANSTSSTHYLTVNGQTYQYDHNSVLDAYNFVPAYTVGSAYTVEPGVCSVKMESEEDSLVLEPGTKTPVRNWNDTGDSIEYYNRHTIYEGTTEVALEAGKLYQVIVWDANGAAAPHVHEFGTPPIFSDVDSLGNTREASFRFYNYFWDTPGEPTKARLYFDVRKKSKGEIIGSYPENGLAFGESTDYITYYCDPAQILNAYNDVYMRQNIRAVWPDGTEKVLLDNDYWTTRPGRSYHFFYCGSYDGQVRTKKLTRFSAK